MNALITRQKALVGASRGLDFHAGRWMHAPQCRHVDIRLIVLAGTEMTPRGGWMGVLIGAKRFWEV